MHGRATRSSCPGSLKRRPRIDCAVDLATEYGTHTLFVGRVLTVHCATTANSDIAPLVWLAGQRAALATPG